LTLILQQTLQVSASLLQFTSRKLEEERIANVKRYAQRAEKNGMSKTGKNE